jgi:hypothetical protein
MLTLRPRLNTDGATLVGEIFHSLVDKSTNQAVHDPARPHLKVSLLSNCGFDGQGGYANACMYHCTQPDNGLTRILSLLESR